MKDRTKIWLNVLLAFAVINFVAGYYCGKAGEAEPVDAPLLSLIEVQRKIGAEPDGKYGRETETKWDEYCANQYAARYFTANGAPKEK